ncbi:hypothetical protein LOK49_LG10G00309 [Camellia lanceoleosa]|uniref:Uncharacterized protein n=1 Tax=Camellia lanceoleosa TaxID=1840588 RepID=A0ACC0GDB1_9ERIC|nr:hypothetical protein LOK49_LG10G00309 [Camellia lanceoleosa]
MYRISLSDRINNLASCNAGYGNSQTNATVNSSSRYGTYPPNETSNGGYGIFLDESILKDVKAQEMSNDQQHPSNRDQKVISPSSTSVIKMPAREYIVLIVMESKDLAISRTSFFFLDFLLDDGIRNSVSDGSNIDCFDDMSDFSHSGKLNNLVVSKTNATMGAGSGYGTFYDESFLDNSHGFSGHVLPFGHVVSQLPHGGKFNNFVVSDGYRTYQTYATRAGGGGGGGGGYGTYYDKNFLNNIKTQEMGYEYDSGWDSSGSQHCLTNNPNGFQQGNQKVEYWASKGV